MFLDVFIVSKMNQHVDDIPVTIYGIRFNGTPYEPMKLVFSPYLIPGSRKETVAEKKDGGSADADLSSRKKQPTESVDRRGSKAPDSSSAMGEDVEEKEVSRAPDSAFIESTEEFIVFDKKVRMYLAGTDNEKTVSLAPVLRKVFSDAVKGTNKEHIVHHWMDKNERSTVARVLEKLRIMNAFSNIQGGFTPTSATTARLSAKSQGSVNSSRSKSSSDGGNNTRPVASNVPMGPDGIKRTFFFNNSVSSPESATSSRSESSSSARKRGYDAMYDDSTLSNVHHRQLSRTLVSNRDVVDVISEIPLTRHTEMRMVEKMRPHMSSAYSAYPVFYGISVTDFITYIKRYTGDEKKALVLFHAASKKTCEMLGIAHKENATMAIIPPAVKYVDRQSIPTSELVIPIDVFPYIMVFLREGLLRVNWSEMNTSIFVSINTWEEMGQHTYGENIPAYIKDVKKSIMTLVSRHDLASADFFSVADKVTELIAETENQKMVIMDQNSRIDILSSKIDALVGFIRATNGGSSMSITSLCPIDPTSTVPKQPGVISGLSSSKRKSMPRCTRASNMAAPQSEESESDESDMKRF